MTDLTADEVVIIVPWRDKGDSWRFNSLKTVLKYLDGLKIGPVFVSSDGRDGSKPFNRSAAYNRGIREHPASVYILHEADMIIPRQSLIDAVGWAKDDPGLVVPFSQYRYLSPNVTEAVYDGADPFTAVPESTIDGGRSNGAVNVVSAETLQLVGQYDEVFQGWGYDDRGMAVGFEKTSGRGTRFVSGPGVHLWHKPGWSVDSKFPGGKEMLPAAERRATAANERRHELYRRAQTPEEIRRLTAGGGGNRVGVAISTHRRPVLLSASLSHWARAMPDVLVVVNDHAGQGVAATKNRGIRSLMDAGCDHLFLADDDCWPVSAGWARLYCDDPEPHLMHCWGRNRLLTNDGHYTTWSWPRGVLLYAERRVIDRVGGMREEFGRWGGEHGEWSQRIHRAGLTRYEFADLTAAASNTWHCEDYTPQGRKASTVSRAERAALDPLQKELFERYKDSTDFVEFRIEYPL